MDFKETAKEIIKDIVKIVGKDSIQNYPDFKYSNKDRLQQYIAKRLKGAYDQGIISGIKDPF